MPPFDPDLINATVQSALARGEATIEGLIADINRDGIEAQQLFNHHFDDLVRARDYQSDVTSYLEHINKVTAAIQGKRDQFPGFGNATTAIQYSSKRRGYYQHFEHGSVFWTEDSGAHEVHGAIRDKYAAMGWHTSYLGFPETDELKTNVAGTEVRYSNFDGGTIAWTHAKGAYIDLSLSAWTERHQLGAWIHMSGKGFTPAGMVRFYVGGLTNMNGRKSCGVFAIARPDGTFSDVVWDGRTWNAGGNAEIIAVDEGSGQEVSRPIPALY